MTTCLVETNGITDHYMWLKLIKKVGTVHIQTIPTQRPLSFGQVPLMRHSVSRMFGKPLLFWMPRVGSNAVKDGSVFDC